MVSNFLYMHLALVLHQKFPINRPTEVPATAFFLDALLRSVTTTLH